jgi:hypothetical protein
MIGTTSIRRPSVRAGSLVYKIGDRIDHSNKIVYGSSFRGPLAPIRWFRNRRPPLLADSQSYSSDGVQSRVGGNLPRPDLCEVWQISNYSLLQGETL